MDIAHHVRIQVFANNDDKEDVRKALISLLPESARKAFEDKKLKIDEKLMKAKREEETDITIYRVYLEKRRHAKEFVDKLFREILKENNENLKDRLCKRIDENCKCYIRLDKKSLINGKYKLTFSGDCFHIRFPVAAYPAKKDNGDKLICNFLDKYIATN